MIAQKKLNFVSCLAKSDLGTIYGGCYDCFSEKAVPGINQPDGKN